MRVGERPFGVTIDADGKRAYTANVASNDVSVIDLESRTVVGTVKVGKRPHAVALAKGRAFVTDSVMEDTVSVFDVASLEPVARIPVGEYPEGIAASRDGSRVYVANWETNTLSVIDTTTMKVVGDVPVADGPRAFGAFIRRTQ